MRRFGVTKRLEQNSFASFDRQVGPRMRSVKIYQTVSLGDSALHRNVDSASRCCGFKNSYLGKFRRRRNFCATPRIMQNRDHPGGGPQHLAPGRKSFELTAPGVYSFQLSQMTPLMLPLFYVVCGLYYS
jgi:hypothetical protein